MDASYGFSKEELAAMRAHFAVFDLDGDGHATFVELQKVFKQLNARVTPSTIMELIREVDINRNGSIEFDEFVRLHWRLKKGGTSAWARLLDVTRPKDPPPRPSNDRRSGDVERGRPVERQPAAKRSDLQSSFSNLAGQASNLLSRAREATDRFLGLSQQSINEDQWNQYSFFERRDVQRPPAGPNPLLRTGVSIRRSFNNLVRSASRSSLHDSHQLLSDDVPSSHPPAAGAAPSNVLINMERLSAQALPSPRAESDDDGFSSDSYEFYSDIDATSDDELLSDPPVQRIVVRTSMDYQPSAPAPTRGSPAIAPLSVAAPAPATPLSVAAPAAPLSVAVPVHQIVPHEPLSPRSPAPAAHPFVPPTPSAPSAAPYYTDQPPPYVSAAAPVVRPAPAAASAGVWTAARAEDDRVINSEAYYDARLARRAQAQRVGGASGAVEGGRASHGQAAAQQPRRAKTRSVEDLARRQRRERNATVRRPRQQPVVLQEPDGEQWIGAGPPQRHRTPWLMILLMLTYTGLLAYAIIAEGGIQPMAINIMAGPSNVKIIQLGAKYEPCMRPPGAATRAHFGITTVHDPIVCPAGYAGERYANSTTLCEYIKVMEYVCAAEFPTDEPNQWWRFITPIFLHTGIIHLVIMLALHIWIGMRLERDLGSIRILLVYFIAGILGNIFAAFAAPLQVSAGSNGAMYGLFGLLYLDLFQNWPVLVSPVKNLIFLTFCFLAALAIGLLPYIDNFAHIGGFGGGIIAGLVFVPTVTFGKWDGRRKRIMAILAFPALVAIYFVGIWRFYYEPDSTCDWCGWLDCVPQGSTWCS